MLDDLTALHLLYTLFLLSQKFHLRSSGIRSQIVGTPALEHPEGTNFADTLILDS